MQLGRMCLHTLSVRGSLMIYTGGPDSDPLQDIDRNGESRGLLFPKFREELLKQSFWSPANDLGRIKLIISEGFPRNSMTNPIERIRNIVAFSFQHAPTGTFSLPCFPRRYNRLNLQLI